MLDGVYPVFSPFTPYIPDLLETEQFLVILQVPFCPSKVDFVRSRCIDRRK